MSARFVCKIPGCRTWGVGGADAWVKHYKTAHDDKERLSTASLSFGFSNYEPERWTGRSWVRPSLPPSVHDRRSS